VNLAGIDLNLLVALDALVSEAHVGRAASRIGLSQPAASHALRRLREIMNDPLLVRAGGKMQLTPRAEALRVPLAQVLEQAGGLFVADAFDPRTSRRRFSLMMPDHVVDLVMPALLDRTAKEAPGVRFDVTPWRGLSSVRGELARSIDLVIACATQPLAGFHQQHLFADTEALAVRRSHRLGARLSRLPTFLEAQHVAVVGRGQREDAIDTWLLEHGIERRIGMVVPSYLQALHMASRTDLVAFVPRRLIETLEKPLSIRLVPPPVDPGEYEEFLFHPARSHADSASIWLRTHVLEVGRRPDQRVGTSRVR
jgi:DNA-binding transcriptional LysR family regulator